MTIVATEIESIHGAKGQTRAVFFRCRDQNGDWHRYGPVITSDDRFDPEKYRDVVAKKVQVVAARDAVLIAKESQTRVSWAKLEEGKP